MMSEEIGGQIGNDEGMVEDVTRALDTIEKGLDDGSVSIRMMAKMGATMLVANVDGDHENRAIVFTVGEESLTVSLFDTDSFGTPIFLASLIGILVTSDHLEMMNRAADIMSRVLSATSERGRASFNDMMELIEDGVS